MPPVIPWAGALYVRGEHAPRVGVSRAGEHYESAGGRVGETLSYPLTQHSSLIAHLTPWRIAVQLAHALPVPPHAGQVVR